MPFVPLQSISGIFQQYELPVQVTGLHVWRRWGDTAGDTGSLSSFPFTSAQSSAERSSQAWTCKNNPSFTWLSSQSRSASVPLLLLTVAGGGGVGCRGGGWEEATTALGECVETETDTGQRKPCVFSLVVEDRTRTGSCDGRHEYEEPGGEVRGGCGQPLLHRDSGTFKSNILECGQHFD